MKTRLHVGIQKISANQKHQFEFVKSEGGMPKLRGQSEQQGAPQILTEVNYY